MDTISPFSLCHDWKVQWYKYDRLHENAMNWVGKREEDMLIALAIVGVISSLQLKKIFLDGDKQRLKKLCATGKLTRHKLFKNQQEIPIFSLGPTGIAMIQERYPVVDWTCFSIPDLLQRLLFFQLVSRFKDENPNIRVLPSIPPFIGSVKRKDKKIHVLVQRGNEEDLIHTFKFYTPAERFILIKETLEHGKTLDEYLQKCKVRMTTDNQMSNHSFSEMFYLWKEGRWVPENIISEEQHSNIKKTSVI
ncbi:hypothetical protein M3589_24140 [Heyndrickxia oleronia]|uniref:hypothetical protein n=1 Tax=Heyndrickxia oleronia TaxID=38875 RepID=UPI00203D2D1F|nr:hypothetical protein [Heyndrickxia oleronia]MCM3240750.1 hypothetical protein [Heyndrickxia oleronia]